MHMSMARIKTEMSAHAGEDLEQGRQSCISGECVNLHTIFGNQAG